MNRETVRIVVAASTAAMACPSVIRTTRIERIRASSKTMFRMSSNESASRSIGIT
jgi:hypothetical protein